MIGIIDLTQKVGANMTGHSPAIGFSTREASAQLVSSLHLNTGCNPATVLGKKISDPRRFTVIDMVGIGHDQTFAGLFDLDTFCGVHPETLSRVPRIG